MPFESVDPASGELLRQWPEHDADEVERRLQVAVEEQQAWARLGFAERAAPLREAARLLRDRADAIGRVMTDEMG